MTTPWAVSTRFATIELELKKNILRTFWFGLVRLHQQTSELTRFGSADLLCFYELLKKRMYIWLWEQFTGDFVTLIFVKSIALEGPSDRKQHCSNLPGVLFLHIKLNILNSEFMASGLFKFRFGMKLIGFSWTFGCVCSLFVEMSHENHVCRRCWRVSSSTLLVQIPRMTEKNR